MQHCKIILFVILFVYSAFSQPFTNWKNYTDMKNVRDVHSFSEGILAATGGGAFFYKLSDNSFTTFTKANGLRGIDLTSVTIDNQGKIWYGSADGILDVYNMNNETFKVILDIFNSNQTNKRINDLNVTGDTIIISTDFGVSLVDAENYIFYDTFFKFGNFPSNTKVNGAVKINLMYVCTDEGIAIQKPGAVNLSAPESWNVFNEINGLPSKKTFKSGSYNGSIIVSTDKGFAMKVDTNWVQFIPEFDQKLISDFQIVGDIIYILSENKIYSYQNNLLTEITTSSGNASSLSYSAESGIAVATLKGVLQRKLNGSELVLIPNGPEANQFPSMSVDNNGVLFSASGKDNLGVGFYTYDGTGWNNFNVNNISQLPSNDVYQANSLPDNTTYLGTWGHGFSRYRDGRLTLFNTANTGMQGIPGNLNFLVITGFGADSRGNTWILNYWAGDRKTLSLLTTDSSWYHFIVPSEPNLTIRGHMNLAVDQYDTKWYSITGAANEGLYYFNENKTYDNTADDRSEFISTQDGLNSNDIRSIVADRRGDIWIGTTLGVNVLSNTSAIPGSNNPPLRLTSVFTLREQSVNAMVVDPLNQKWIGTNEGLLLVNSDGSRLLAVLNSENSALLSDRIQSLAIDENAGIVYVGTEEGLTSFETPYIKPLESFDKLFVFPNPYLVNQDAGLLTIDGLIRDTEIKILTVAGNLISEFSSPGGRTAYWDGKDMDGNYVGSGVYLIVAFDQEGNNVTTGKVAVIKE